MSVMPWPGLARRFPALGYRDFRLLLADRLLAPGAFAFSMVGVSFAVLDATGSTADLSYVLAAQILPALVFAMVGGVFADRFAPQRVIVAANVMIAAGEGGFGLLVLLGQPQLWQMIGLETLTGAGMAVFYPASQALLPRLVPGRLLQEASAMSRLAMNAAQMAGAGIAGVFVAATGPGWALATCGIGMFGTVPLLLAIRAPGAARTQSPNVLRELRDGWSAFASRRWLWATTIQYSVVLAAWYGAFDVLGPVVAREHLGGPAAWGLITAADAVGLIVGGVIALRVTVQRPILCVVLIGATCSITPLALAALWPLPVICLAAVGLGIAVEFMMVQWTVTMARNVPADLLARVSAYDVIGSVGAMPLGALVVGPIAAAAGVSATQYGAAALIVLASALTLLAPEVRQLRAGVPAGGEEAPGGAEPAPVGAEAA
jgi:predicted MFS family arabinose efflux permease